MDFPSWGNLHELPDDALRKTLADMLDCWRANQPFPSAADPGMNPSTEPAWFSQYGSEAGIERLFTEITSDEMREQYLAWAAYKN